jgi:hypothetical protein
MPAAPAAPAGGADLITGAIGGFTMVLVVVILLITIFGAGRGLARGLLVLNAFLTLGALTCMAVGFLGMRRVTGNGLALACSVVLFIGALLAILPLIAGGVRSRGFMEFLFLGGKIIGIATWAMAGILFLQSRRWIGAALAMMTGIVFLVTATWGTTELVLMFSRAAGRTFVAQVGLVFTILHMLGIVTLSVSFLKLRTARA